MNIDLCNYLSQFVTSERLELFDKILKKRSRYITVALEDIFQSHNASAVLRTADCFGIQDVHVIENRNEYSINPDVSLGSSKWINLIRYNQEENNTLSAIKNLKEKGYRIIATTPHSNDINLDDFNLAKGKSVFFFGTELTGLSKTVLDNADEFVKIPMYGFTESFNISVSAAIILNHLSSKLIKSDINWQISEEEAIEIKINWLKESIKKSDLLIQKFELLHTKK